MPVGYTKGYLSDEQSAQIIQLIEQEVLPTSPWFRPQMPRTGAKFRYEMTNAGYYGWWSDVKGYRYLRNDPRTDEPWADIPEQIREIMEGSAQKHYPGFQLQSLLINKYFPGDKLGMHQDVSERNDEAPVMSLSFGLTGKLMVGGKSYSRSKYKFDGPLKEYYLGHGDGFALIGDWRFAPHAMVEVIEGSHPLGYRLNLTGRMVDPAPVELSPNHPPKRPERPPEYVPPEDETRPEELPGWVNTVENAAAQIKPGMKVAIIGSRDFDDNGKAQSDINKFVSLVPKEITVHSGGVRGACRFGESAAKKRGIPIKIFYPKELTIDHGLPPSEVARLLKERSERMIDESDFMIVFRNSGASPGTDHEIIYTFEVDKRIIVFRERTEPPKSLPRKKNLYLSDPDFPKYDPFGD